MKAKRSSARAGLNYSEGQWEALRRGEVRREWHFQMLPGAALASSFTAFNRLVG